MTLRLLAVLMPPLLGEEPLLRKSSEKFDEELVDFAGPLLLSPMTTTFEHNLLCQVRHRKFT
jgi:hypothetical protein